jgi:hypothetical protein
MAITLNGTTGISNDGGYTGDGISFADTTPSNTLVTTTGGNVGIGTSSPTNFGSAFKMLAVQGSDYGVIQAISSSGSTTLEMMGASGIGYVGTRTNHPVAFRTNDSERMRIDSSGNLLVGTTSALGDAGKISIYGGNCLTAKADGASGNFRFQNSSGTQIGYIQWSGSSTSYVTSSDYRLKEDIAPMTGALATVQALKPVTYKWKIDGSDGQGFIAHELAEIVPDCVTGEKDAVDAEGNPQYQGIDTSFLVATLTAAIKEQQAIITDLKSRIEALEQA